MAPSLVMRLVSPQNAVFTTLRVSRTIVRAFVGAGRQVQPNHVPSGRPADRDMGGPSDLGPDLVGGHPAAVRLIATPHGRIREA